MKTHEISSKIRSCWLGKMIAGAIGAPFRIVKHARESNGDRGKEIDMKGTALMSLAAGCLFAAPIEAEEFNIAPYCALRSTPYAGFTLTRLVDGVTADTSGKSPVAGYDVEFCSRTFQTDMRLGASVIFAFPDSRELRSIRMFATPYAFEGLQIGTAPEYALFADVAGTGKFDTRIGAVPNKADGWLDFKLEKTLTCKGVKIVSASGNDTMNFGLTEVQIHVAGQEPAAPEAKAGIKAASAKALTPCELRNDDLHRTIYAWGPGIYDRLDEFAQRVVDLGANTVILYPNTVATVEKIERGEVSLPEDKECLWYVNRGVHLLKAAGKKDFNIATWPSKVVLGTKENTFKKTCEAFHRRGVKVIASAMFYIPFDLFKVYGHSGQSDWHGINPSPCFIGDDFPVRAGNQLYAELVANGADGVILGGAEFGLEGHRFTQISPYDPCVKKFLGKYGYDSLPVDAEDTLKYRRWEMFEYEGLAQVFKAWADNIRRIKPDAVTTCLLSPSPECASDRMWSGLAYDIIGFQSGMDYLGTDYYRPETTIKKLIAASPSRKGAYTWTIGYFRPGYLPYEQEVDLIGPVLSVLGQSGKGLASIELYEHRHVFSGKADPEKERGAQLVKGAFTLIKQLQARGVREAEPPQDVAVLCSRSSEDWWQLRNGYLQSRSPALMQLAWGKEHWKQEFSKLITPERTKANFHQMTGHIWHQAVMDLLASRGYSYDVFYLDQPEGLKNIGDYKTLIIPFAHSLSRQAADLVAKTATKGRQILIINQLGETDEWGEKFDAPILAPLTTLDNVRHLNIDITDKGEKDLATIILPLLDRSSPDRATFSLPNDNLYGKAFCFFLKKADRYFITLVNYDNRDIAATVALPRKLRKLEGLDTKSICDYPVEDGNGFTYSLKGGSAVVFVADVE